MNFTVSDILPCETRFSYFLHGFFCVLLLYSIFKNYPGKHLYFKVKLKFIYPRIEIRLCWTVDDFLFDVLLLILIATSEPC